MKMRTSELSGTALDWAVAKCEEFKIPDGEIFIKDGVLVCRTLRQPWGYYQPSESWAQGGPIIERERIVIGYINDLPCASLFEGSIHSAMEFGPTPLIAAMRCYVASKLGPEIEIPDELGAQP